MQALLLAGGLGTRLRSVVSDRPKPMADVCGKPFLEYLIQELKNMPGVKEVRGKGLMIGVDVKISQEEVR